MLESRDHGSHCDEEDDSYDDAENGDDDGRDDGGEGREGGDDDFGDHSAVLAIASLCFV